MISTKKILEGCLLAIARDTTEKWNLYMDGVEFADDDVQHLTKKYYINRDYKEHLIPMYKLCGHMAVNLRSGLSAEVAFSKRKPQEIKSGIPQIIPRNVTITSLLSFTPDNEIWWKECQSILAHTTIVIRDKKYIRVKSSDLVVSDIVFATAGDIIGADVRVIVCSPGTVVDISSITGITHDIKEIQEKSTDINPLYSCNLAPAKCGVLEGIFFGIVIKIGEDTVSALIEKSRREDTLSSDTEIVKYPFVLKHGTALVKQSCELGCFPVDIDRLLSIRSVQFVVISLAFGCEGLCDEILGKLTQEGRRVVICRDMDVCYDKSIWKPDDGYLNVSCQDNDIVNDAMKRFLDGEKRIVGLTVHPNQYFCICKVLRESGSGKVLFLGGNSYEHVVAMNVSQINISFYYYNSIVT